MNESINVFKKRRAPSQHPRLYETRGTFTAPPKRHMKEAPSQHLMTTKQASAWAPSQHPSQQNRHLLCNYFCIYLLFIHAHVIICIDANVSEMTSLRLYVQVDTDQILREPSKLALSPASPDTELLASGELPDSKKAQLSLMTCVRQKNFMCVIFVRNLQKLKTITTPFPQIGLVVLILLVFSFLTARAIRLTP